METAPELDLDEAVFLRSKPFSLNKKQKSLHCKFEGVQDDDEYTVEDYEYCLEIKEIKNGANCPFRSHKHEISMVKRKKFALKTFDDKRCCND